MKELKHELYQQCQQWIDDRVQLAQETIRLAQESSNEETKSSAGDKYETARAMAQLEKEKGSIQLAEAAKLKRMMQEFSPSSQSITVALGSLVKANESWYYISVSAGKMTLDKIHCICLSPVSPLGAAMIGLAVGDSFTFNKQAFKINELH